MEELNIGSFENPIVLDENNHNIQQNKYQRNSKLVAKHKNGLANKKKRPISLLEKGK